MPDAFPQPMDLEAADRVAAQAAREAARTVSGTLRVAQALVACQRCVDLTGLDSAVGALCARILDLAPDAARGLRPALVDMLAQLDRLDSTMQQAAAPS
jgi:hypothetical protein